jgi:hypothetical protein
MLQPVAYCLLVMVITLMMASRRRNSVLFPVSHWASLALVAELSETAVSEFRAITNNTRVAMIITTMSRKMIFLSILFNCLAKLGRKPFNFG